METIDERAAGIIDEPDRVEDYEKIEKRQGSQLDKLEEFKSKELERVELQNGQREKEEDLEMRKVRFEMANENQIVAPSFAIWS